MRLRPAVKWSLVGAVALGVGGFAWYWFTGGTGTPSADLTTPTVATGPAGTATFVISSEESRAVFEIDEVLRGQPNHVVGSTSEVAGEISVDPDDLSSAVFSRIVVNARTFQTDNQLRDRAIRGPIILNSADDRFELITFDVVSAEGLSGPARVGTPFRFSVTGNLTVKGTVGEVTFEVTATLEDPARLVGVAEATVLRSMFDIGIPNVPDVADVTDEVVIRLEFVAVAP